MRDCTKGAAALGRWRTTAIDSLEGPQELQKSNHQYSHGGRKEPTSSSCPLIQNTHGGGGGELGLATGFSK